MRIAHEILINNPIKIKVGEIKINTKKRTGKDEPKELKTSGQRISELGRETARSEAAVEKEMRYVRQLRQLSKMAVGLVNLSPEDNLYQYIAGQLEELVGDCLVIVNSFDEKKEKFCVRSVLGLGKNTNKVLTILKKHPVGMITPINDEAREGLLSGKLEKVPNGLYDLAVGTIPKAACDAIESLLNLGDAYAMGFSWSGRLYGSAVAILQKGDEIDDPGIIEMFIRQASVAFQRRRAEEALHKANEELELRVKERTKELARSNEDLQNEIAERKKIEEQLRSSLEEKEVLLREIYHRVKNNMQIISSLLRLQARTIADKELLGIFEAAHNRIKTMAFVHEGLYRSKDLAKIDFSDYVKRLTTHLFSVYSSSKKKIDLILDVEEIFLDVNTAIPCGLIINELVTNSLKHAFPETDGGEVCVKMKKNLGQFTLTVKDSGIGFPKTIDFRMADTLGMQLVTDTVKQLGGSIRLERRGGTGFTIEFESAGKGK